MNFSIILTIFIILVFGVFSVNSVTAQIDPFSDIEFLQTGMFDTSEKQFHISNEIIIREFGNGNIVRVSGLTVEGFSYVTYSKILNDKIITNGIIFINGQFINLIFQEEQNQKEDVEKIEDIIILDQHTQRIYSNNFAGIDIKIFNKQQNKLNNFYQNYGQVSNTNIQVIVVNENNQEIYSSSGITNTKGLFEIEFFIPENSKKETLTVTINAENENSKSSKTLQIFNLGTVPNVGE